MSNGLEPRRIAARVFTEVVKRQWTVESALEAAPGYNEMEARDRAFARAMTATALRRVGQTEAVLNSFLSKPLNETSTSAQAILMIGATQLLWMGVPAHAVVSSAVDLAAERADARKLKGLINAVLRKVANEGMAIANNTPPQDNLPEWLRSSWRKAYGPGRLSRMTDVILKPPPLDITLKDPAQTEYWAEQLEARILPTGSLRRDGIGDVTALPGFDEGAWWAQDVAAAIPARLLNVQPKERVVDLCAAPGGKTMQLAAAGALVTAIDSSATRLKRVTQNLTRTGLDARIIATDGRGWTPKRPVDAVLLDAPCTATGTLRRHPEAAWIKRPSDVFKMRDIQMALVKSAEKMMRPGGRLVVCTCSLQPEEGEYLAMEIARHYKSLTPFPVDESEVPGLSKAISPEGFLRLTPANWSDHGGMDGFFIARFTKSA
jgi:16S rRNA (cytosine967-C5)-methyltransferase